MCYNPQYIKLDGSTGSGAIAIMRNKGFLWQEVSCKKCLECKSVRARGVALRSEFEMPTTELSCFITLTYDNKHNPYFVVTKQWQDFIKRFRRQVDYHGKLKIRQLYSGEYGCSKTTNYRPHWHAIIYGYDFTDKYRIEDSDSGHPQYMSDTLDKLWGKGRAVVQHADEGTAYYAAKYSAKPQDLPDYLKNYPEVNRWSQGLGIELMAQKYYTWIKTDEVWCNGKAHPIPEALFNYMARRHPKFEQLRENGYETTKALKQVKEYYMPEYGRIKRERRARAEHRKQELLAKYNGDVLQMLADRKYVAESRHKRRRKGLDQIA